MKHKLTGLAALGVGIAVVLVAQPDLKAQKSFTKVEEVHGHGRTPSAPAAVSFLDKAGTFFLDIFVRGTDDRIYWNKLGVTEWNPLGGEGAFFFTISEPTAVFHGGIEKLFVRSSANGIWESHALDRTNWSTWTEVPGGGETLSGPAAVVDRGTLKLFVRGLDNGIFENDFNGTTWSGWSELPGGGLTISTPAPVVHSDTLKLFVRGLDNGIFENDFNGTNWSGWSEVPGGGLTLAGPSALADHGVLKLFITGLDDAVWENDFMGGGVFSRWSRVSDGALTPSAPAAVVEAGIPPPFPPPLVFLRAEDGRILVGSFF